MEPWPSSSTPVFGLYNQAELRSEQLLGLLHMEPSYRVHHVPCSAPEDRSPLDEWRRKICQWSFRVVDHFQLDRECVSVAANILDRFLVSYHPNNEENDEKITTPQCLCPACKRAIDSSTYQLAAMSSLYLSIKLHIDNGSEGDCSRRKQFRLETFTDLSRGMFTSDDICKMEQTILQTVGWRVCTPTPMTFVSYFLTLLPLRTDRVSHSFELVIHVLRELSRYLTELAVCLGSDCIYQPSSKVGFATLLVSMDLLTPQALPLSLRNKFFHRVHRLCQWSQTDSTAIEYLRDLLQQTLLPEMLLVNSDSTHPIALARDCDLLDMHRIGSTATPLTPPRKGRIEWEESQASPVSVIR
jgi:hypothetical protein